MSLLLNFSLLTARNAQAAEKSVDQIVADIKHGTVDPEIVQAALAKGLIIKAIGPKARRSPELEARRAAVIKGPKGMPHAPSKIAQHIASSGYIPPKIMEALIASKHYLRPGQKPSNPTAPPQGKPGRQGNAAAQGGATGNNKKVNSATPNSKKIGGRDLEELYVRDLENIYAREAEPGVTHEELKALIHATQRDPEAEKAVYHALTMDRNVEKVTENLVKDWTTKEDMEKRDAIADAYLEAREAEADYLEAREAEADYLEVREAEAEAEADWEE